MMVYPYSGVLLSNKNQWLWAGYNVDESHKNYWVKEARETKKTVYAVWFPLHNILEKCKLTYTDGKSVQFSSVSQLCPTLCDPMNYSTPGFPVHHQLPKSLPKLMSIELVMPSNHLILCRPLLLLPSIFPSIRIFSDEWGLCLRWPKYWSFSFNISLSNEHPGLISFRMNWLDLLAVQGTLKSLLQHHSSKA